MAGVAFADPMKKDSIPMNTRELDQKTIEVLGRQMSYAK
ncbi:MAG: hypothetical protein CM1200mP41_35150 [Gammaproteobacteria bacterium]|nr:MAG: hypothetical protein CM1200mP41_35150 [Gammaproteobacteria bacterium]